MFLIACKYWVAVSASVNLKYCSICNMVLFFIIPVWQASLRRYASGMLTYYSLLFSWRKNGIIFFKKRLRHKRNIMWITLRLWPDGFPFPFSGTHIQTIIGIEAVHRLLPGYLKVSCNTLRFKGYGCRCCLRRTDTLIFLGKKERKISPHYKWQATNP